MCTLGPRLLWHVYGRSEPDPRRHQVNKEDPPGKGIIYERADPESREQGNNEQRAIKYPLLAIFARPTDCVPGSY